MKKNLIKTKKIKYHKKVQKKIVLNISKHNKLIEKQEKEEKEYLNEKFEKESKVGVVEEEI